jgi:hypothetical protein
MIIILSHSDYHERIELSDPLASRKISRMLFPEQDTGWHLSIHPRLRTTKIRGYFCRILH